MVGRLSNGMEVGCAEGGGDADKQKFFEKGEPLSASL